jgi:hypothetical protein
LSEEAWKKERHVVLLENSKFTKLDVDGTAEYIILGPPGKLMFMVAHNAVNQCKMLSDADFD